MNGHLTPEQFVDLVEGAARESSFPHLAGCVECRQELADVRAMMAEAADVEVPEPPPLFWNRLSARVREAVADEASRPRSWRAWLLQPRVFVPTLAGALAVALVAVLLPRTSVTTTIPSTPLPIAEATLPSLPPLAPLAAADDPQLRIVAAVATTVSWDDMMDELAMAGTGDALASELTPDEQRELQRLLTEEMAQARALEKRS